MVFRGGYWGKVAWINLGSRSVVVREFGEEYAKKYLGGVGFGIKMVSEVVTKNVDPLSPRNVLVFSTGAYQAATIAGAGRWSACSRSPLTGYWGESNAGGHGGPALKKAGFDAIAITGRASRPTYLWIHDGKIEFRDASRYWGMDTAEVTDALKEEVGDKDVSVAAIGPAGENLVKYAVIANDKHGFFGRTGLGAVMGSKNLKAIAIQGTMSPPIADPDKLKEMYREILKKVLKAPFTKVNSEDGQAAAVVPREENGLLPMRNWAKDRWPDGAKKIGTPRFTEELKPAKWPCSYCVMGCHRRITNPEYESKTAGPEYETLAMLGSNLLIDDLKVLVKANDLCNRYGVDTIELGGVLGWAFDAYEAGVLTKQDTGGAELKWGSSEALLTMIEKISKREGIGDLLAEGLRACVEAYPETKPYAVEVMGQAVAAHDPRAYFGETITTIALTRGSCHIHGFAEAIELGVTIPELGLDKPMDRFEWEKKGLVGAVFQDVQQFWNSLVWCFFYFFSDVTLTDQVAILNAITGWNLSPKDAAKIGERIVNMQHCFNLRMGLDPLKENVMPERLCVPHKEGGAAGKIPPWKKILEDYWRARDWINGIPTRRKLIELGLEEFAKELYGY